LIEGGDYTRNEKNEKETKGEKNKKGETLEKNFATPPKITYIFTHKKS
jgi:hypothetical protein